MASLCMPFSRAMIALRPTIPPSLNVLPEEILLMILVYLPPSDLAPVARVSTKFFRITAPYIWGTLDDQATNPHIRSLLTLAKGVDRTIPVGPSLPS